MAKMALKMRCVECEAPIMLGESQCANGHQYSLMHDVHCYLKADFKSHFDKWLKCLEDFRKQSGDGTPKMREFDLLPSTNDPSERRLWKPRALELDFIRKKLVGKTELRILEVGSWIGWLANSLTQEGHNVVSIDYFTDPLDGLRAKQHYSNSDWLSIQMDVEHPEIIDEKFDVIIFNHNLPYFTNIKQSLNTYMSLLDQLGHFFIIGLNILKDTSEIDRIYQAHEARFQKDYGISMQFKPMKSCIDTNDQKMLVDYGFELIKEPRMRLNNFKNSFNPKKPQYCHALLKK
jgi:2-polyprenyl-3-methyl-5-hydroxy-6-metoxy-1,4-benzoquinol methylase